VQENPASSEAKTVVDDSGAPAGSRSWEGRILQLVLCLSILLNLLFALEIRRLRVTLTGPPQVALTGQKARPLVVTTVDGHTLTLDLASSDKPTVIYYFRPDCHWCIRNLDNISALADQESAAYHFIGLSPPDLRLAAYVSAHHLSFPVFSVGSPGPVNALSLLGSTPQTLVINKTGIIVQNWIGAYAGPTEKSVDGFFHVRLPGLLPETAP
jgi:peroxiredoxin